MPRFSAIWSRYGLGLLLAITVLAASLLPLLRPPQPGPQDPVQLLAGQSSPLPVQLSGQLLTDPRFTDPRPTDPPQPCRVVLQLSGGRTELAFPACPTLQQGWWLRVSGSLRRPQPAPHPLLSGSAERLARQGAWSQLQVEEWQVLRRPATPIASLRRAIAGRLLAVAGPERGGLLAALVLGSAVVPLPQEVRDAFRVAGLSHALAASGFHLSVLLGAVMAVARQGSRPLRLSLAAGAMLLFLVLAGPQPSVVRAVLMGAIALLVLEGGRRGRPLAILAFTVLLMLLLRPDWLLDVGFQLSVAATAGLVLTARPLQEGLQRRLPAPLAAALAASLAVPLAAAAWTLPLQLLHFGVVPLYAVPANLVAAPFLTPLTLGAMGLSLVALLIPPLLPLLAAPFSLLTGLLLAVVKWFAALPLAQWPSGRPLPLLVLLLALALLAWLLPNLRRRWRLLGAGLLALAVAVHLALVSSDQLLLVHQGSRDLLVARHRGRSALISRTADPISCHQARQLATGLGVSRFDWLLLLDPVAPAEPACWQQQATLVLATGEAGRPLLRGQRLQSPGLSAERLDGDSWALQLSIGQRRWLLLPDQQAYWAWRRGDTAPPPTGVWLGYVPRPRESEALQRLLRAPAWLSGEAAGPLPPGWRATGRSGSLLAAGAPGRSVAL
ncbi:MAG: ComEC/Rec2 family competence protein [Prochlorococcaceae cyanobacterium]